VQRDPLPISPGLQEALNRLGDEFLAGFYEAETERHPGNLDALAELGQVHTRLGHYDRGLTVDRQLVRLVPDNPTAHYNLACSLARLERAVEALDSLERAVELGFADAEFMQSDEDLASLRAEERFRSLVRLIGERATA
jgi:Flp pilus assembly protein TadD